MSVTGRERDIIRPRQSILVVMVVAYYALIALVVVGALRARQPVAAWVGVAFGVLFLPAIDLYRTALVLGAEALTQRSFTSTRRIAWADVIGYGEWKAWTYRSGVWHWVGILGRDGTRIDVPITISRRADIDYLLAELQRRAPQAPRIVPEPVRSGVRVYLTLALGLVIIAASLILLGAAFEHTLDAEGLFDISAAAGIVVGLVLGVAFGQRALPRSPATFATMSALVMLVVSPLVATYWNAFHPSAWHTAHVTVLERQTRIDRKGRESRIVALDIDGVRKDLSPSRALFDRLGTGTTYSGCIATGGLGYPVIADYTRPCRDR